MGKNDEYYRLSREYYQEIKSSILSNLNNSFIITDNTNELFIIKTNYFIFKITKVISYELIFTKIDHHESYDEMINIEDFLFAESDDEFYGNDEKSFKDIFDEINEYYYSLVNDCFYVKNYERHIEIAYRNRNKYRYGDINVDDMFYSKVITWSKPWRFFKFLQPTLSYYDSYLDESALLDAGFKKLKLY